MVHEIAPLVSIGVPTYNRPEGLRRTLLCLSNQTHPNLDILVSDNCSPGKATANVVAEMAERDPRIRFVRQTQSLGVSGNFRFVLRETAADYFMWAADDDTWRPGFIERCLNAMQNGAVSAMSGFQIVYRISNRVIDGRMPAFGPRNDVAKNIAAFFHRMTPSLVYGLHRRSAIDFFLKDDFFDYYDCYFALRLLANGGIALVPEQLYEAGIEAEKYIVKPMGKSWGSGLQYAPFYRAVHRLFAETQLTGAERVRLNLLLAITVAKLFSMNETRHVIKYLGWGGNKNGG